MATYVVLASWTQQARQGSGSGLSVGALFVGWQR